MANVLARRSVAPARRCGPRHGRVDRINRLRRSRARRRRIRSGLHEGPVLNRSPDSRRRPAFTGALLSCSVEDAPRCPCTPERLRRSGYCPREVPSALLGTTQAPQESERSERPEGHDSREQSPPVVVGLRPASGQSPSSSDDITGTRSVPVCNWSRRLRRRHDRPAVPAFRTTASRPSRGLGAFRNLLTRSPCCRSLSRLNTAVRARERLNRNERDHQPW